VTACSISHHPCGARDGHHAFSRMVSSSRSFPMQALPRAHGWECKVTKTISYPDARSPGAARGHLGDTSGRFSTLSGTPKFGLVGQPAVGAPSLRHPRIPAFRSLLEPEGVGTRSLAGSARNGYGRRDASASGWAPAPVVERGFRPFRTLTNLERTPKVKGPVAHAKFFQGLSGTFRQFPTHAGRRKPARFDD
jgi:hypothetical protein